MNARKIKGWKLPVSVAAGVLVLAGAVTATVTAESSHQTPVNAADTSTASADTHQPKPTVVLLAGAFEDSTAWNGEITQLQHDGYPVIAPAIPLRGVASDSTYITTLVKNINGPVILVGHSFGGIIETEVAAQDPQQIKALVYTAAFIPTAGDSAGQLLAQFPGSLLGPDTTYTVPYPGGATDTYVKPTSFHSLFAGDRSTTDAAIDAATQRPINTSALGEPTAAGVPAGIPVYAIVASQDKAIPPAAERWEAQRAHATITTINSSHDLPTTHPTQVTQTIEHAAR